MKSFTFRLPVKRYIQKYLVSKYGESIPVEMDSDVGFVVLQTLASRVDGKVSRGYNNQFGSPIQDTVTFHIPYYYFYLTRKEISPQTIILLNRYFENKFEEDLCNYVHSINLAFRIKKSIVENMAGKTGLTSRHLLEEHGGLGEFSRKQAIIQFVQSHGIEIEDDITLQNLVKMEYRFRKKNENKFVRRLSFFSGVKNIYEKATA